MKFLAAACLAVLSACPSFAGPSMEEAANPTGKTVNNAPAWAKPGTLVYRVSTPDSPDVLDSVEAGIGIVSHLLDGSIHQIPILNGIIGHDHPGVCNWDGLWPDWNRVTFRANHSWTYLDDFMVRVRDKYQATPSFHVNLTDVNAGLRDYPESRAFFEQLVATKSMYRRDRNPQTNKRDVEPPYVPTSLPPETETKEALRIVALVNYENFWESGLAKEMIDQFYHHLPYAPPLLYLDVLTTAGSNFSTGFPDGPLGGSEAGQLRGIHNIAAYLQAKGTDLATEGNRTREAAPYARYEWLHAHPGISSDDYRIISGASSCLPLQQVAGNTGSFNLSPVASSKEQLAMLRAHYARLVAGVKDTRLMPGLETCHLADRGDAYDAFSIPGADGDHFRGDWIDLVNNFYLTGIQELYHIGKGNVRVAVLNTIGVLHVSKLVLSDGAAPEIVLPVLSLLPKSAPKYKFAEVAKSGHYMMEDTLATQFEVSHAGNYALKLFGNTPGNDSGSVNVTINGQLQLTVNGIKTKSRDDWQQEIDLGMVTLQTDVNQISIDPGPLYMKWSDGTVAVWPEPAKSTGLKIINGDLTFADNYDRMWPDTWSGQLKIYFYSWDGTNRSWKLPAEWVNVQQAMLYPLTPDGRGSGVPLEIRQRTVNPRLLQQVPYVLLPVQP